MLADEAAQRLANANGPDPFPSSILIEADCSNVCEEVNQETVDKAGEEGDEECVQRLASSMVEVKRN